MSASILLGFTVLSLVSLAPAAHAIDTEPAYGPLEDVARERTACYLSRFRPDRPGEFNVPSGGCHFSDSQVSFYAELTRTFCERPQQFCEFANGPRDDRFVNSRCQRGAQGRFDLNQYFGRHVGETGSLYFDRRVGRTIEDAWGCTSSVEAKDIETSVTRSHGRRTAVTERRPTVTMSCDKDKMPPGLSCNWNSATPGSERFTALNDPSKNPTAAAQAGLRQRSDRMRENGGKCEMDFSSPLSGLPAIPAGQSLADYRAGLTDPQRASLQGGLDHAKEDADMAFSQASDVITNGKKSGFEMFTRMALAEGRGQRLKENFERAQRAVRNYLLMLKPPAPKLVVDQIMNTDFMDVDALMGTRGAAARDTAMRDLELSCFDRDRGSSLPTGANNAFNSTKVPPGRSKITVCPESLYSEEFMNPNGILVTLMHELGHSIDTCTLGMMTTQVKPWNPTSTADCTATPPYKAATSDPAEQRAFEAFVAKVNGPGSVSECMHAAPAVRPYTDRDPSLPGFQRNAQVRAEAEAARRHFSSETKRREFIETRRLKYIEEGQNAVSRPAYSARTPLTEADYTLFHSHTTPSIKRCGFDAIKPGGPLAQCNMGDWNPNSNPAVRRINSLQRDQTGEAFADMIAAGALPEAMMLEPGYVGMDMGCGPYDTNLPPVCNSTLRADPHLNDLQGPERQAEVLTMVSSDFCWLGSNTGRDEHPDSEARISMLAGNQLLRKRIGCVPESARAPSPEFPGSACAARLSPNDPFWGGHGPHPSPRPSGTP